MEKFLVVYLAPIAGLEEWKKVEPALRKEEESKMEAAWAAWAKKNESAIVETAGTGNTKLVTQEGVSDTKNNMMLYSIIEAESHDAAAAIFIDHPHLQIPGSTIEIMKINPLSGMGE